MLAALRAGKYAAAAEAARGTNAPAQKAKPSKVVIKKRREATMRHSTNAITAPAVMPMKASFIECLQYDARYGAGGCSKSHPYPNFSGALRYCIGKHAVYA